MCLKGRRGDASFCSRHESNLAKLILVANSQTSLLSSRSVA